MWARRQNKFCVPPQEVEGDITYIRRVAGLKTGKMLEAPWRAPHHTVSAEAMTGLFQKGYKWRPGELSLAHGGTLFLDEVPEFQKRVLERTIAAITMSISTTQASGGISKFPPRFDSLQQ